ncbi:DUF4280 domain-containing protein [Pseudactinotalea suaedae]|uniref:DUF4280 domain-containing protein n=1 Tax=Pseudactinotalea suaedae TaxID=1524924 RepID=UPI0012E2E957|nr:DUF4280 domain-containing protein [Pseudactinotalea suaedae]
MGRPAGATGGTLMCPFGAATSAVVGLASPTVLIEGKPAVTMRDNLPMANVPSFGLCSSPSNPTVVAATAAAMGVLTPMPCVPVLTPWTGTATRTLVGGAPALAAGSMCTCVYGGVIQLVNPGTVRTMVG